MNLLQDKGRDSLIVKLVDSAVERYGGAADRRVAALRKKFPQASPAELVERLTTEYTRVTIGSGAGIGATAAIPGAGTAASLALSAGEVVSFIELTVRYVLTVAAIYGELPDNSEGRRALVVGVMLGESGVRAAQRAVGSSEKGWARQLGARVPSSRGGSSLGRTFITRFAVRKSAGIVGRALPFGVGAVLGGAANYAAGGAVVKGVRAAFGQAPRTWGPKAS
ncbi:hypothetical protein [Dermatophilus congolensis]|uniref:hypothetical protein n=1 Tax=Dermatophilus congolensis TaxID=1863 RepID=UPI001AB01A8A|nr:hypothetical protein [Dermatophilus congolensis]MBO3156450.1 hypothetical protein [Dermatophilus congolensis]MBO3158725.1 hypothetical protein [Dermatophilus congolensis]MBO3165484.1 hypothetical protein [Dermatophilus congolensis]MBO3169997.1 hypothetical protein [Dermatophilus congolensis]MBO3174521.1 hypothetical protein [Dermatophilus congolensis]